MGIDLCATLFDWPVSTNEGAVKLDRLLDHDGDPPSVAVITEGSGWRARGPHLRSTPAPSW